MKSKLLVLKPNSPLKVNVEQDTQYVLSFESFNEKDYYEVDLVFDKQGVSAELLCVYNLNEKQALNLSTRGIHNATNTSCNQIVRGVLNNSSKSEYLGSIIINRGAQQTSSFLDDKVLVTGEGVHNRSDPILQIEANEVKASHGATTGRINEKQLYYLQSRGLTKKEAEETIITGFFEAVLSKIADESIMEQVESNLNL